MARTLGGASVAGMLVALLLAGPVSAGPGQVITLAEATVSPTTGTTATSITFRVLYKNSWALPPDYVRVAVGGMTLTMQVDGSTGSWKKGVWFTATGKLPAGSWTPRFDARDRQFHFGTASGPALTITPAATPTPAPTPKPPPKPTPKPTPAPTPRATPRPTPRPTPRATPRPTPRPAPRATPRATAKPAHTSKPTRAKPSPKPTAKPAAAPSPSPTPSGSPNPGIGLVLPGAGGGQPGGPDGGGSGGGRGPINDGGLPTGSPGGDSPIQLLLRLMPMLVATAGAVTLAMAFAVFGKRRRADQPGSDDELAAAAAAGMGYVPGAGTAVPSAAEAAAAVSAVQAAASAVAAGDVDGHLPRWRRPSLVEARKADPTRFVTAGAKLTFDGTPDAVNGMERRRIRYRLVSLLDAPDEVRGSEIGSLDEGDEVVLLEKLGTYWRVLCPNGQQGWLHKMTLGDVVIESAAPDTWTAADNVPTVGTFEDILRAYTEGRRQFGEA